MKIDGKDIPMGKMALNRWRRDFYEMCEDKRIEKTDLGTKTHLRTFTGVEMVGLPSKLNNVGLMKPTEMVERKEYMKELTKKTQLMEIVDSLTLNKL